MEARPAFVRWHKTAIARWPGATTGHRVSRHYRRAVDALDRFVEEQLALWEVPGCAVGVIHGDGIVMNAGFGTKELDVVAPISAKTLFPIGSTTKSFTAAAVATLVDDGLIEWDRPIRDYIPGFTMHDTVATERITARDLLAHRSGLPRHEFVWLGHADRTRAELVDRLRHLPFSKDIRQAWQYSNLGYVAAGYLVDVVGGMRWEEYLTTRLLKPLGMDRSNVSVTETQRADDVSLPHERRDGRIVRIPFRDLSHIGPAGGINSAIDDMLAYVRAQLGGSESGAISSQAIAEMHRPQMVLPEDRTFPESTRFAYGLGWVVGQYRGHRIVEHNGGVDGFLTDCMMLPDDGIGVVVLTNCWSLMGPAIAYRVFDELLGLEPLDWAARLKEQFDALNAAQDEARSERQRVEGAVIPRPLEEYAGEYEHPGYGTFGVAVEGDRLIPRFGTLDLSLTHRHYDVFDLEWHELVNQEIAFPLTFLTAPDGSVHALEVPFEEEVAPIRFERRPDTSG